MFANEMVYSSLAFWSIGPDNSDIWLSMFAMSCGFAAALISAGSNDTLCGPPLTITHFTASPCLIVMSAGSNLYVVPSPIILTSTVLPVAGAFATRSEERRVGEE